MYQKTAYALLVIDPATGNIVRGDVTSERHPTLGPGLITVVLLEERDDDFGVAKARIVRSLEMDHGAIWHRYFVERGTSELERETERMNAALDAAEHRLNAMNFGVTACVQVEVTAGRMVTLEYSKNGNAWGLYVSEGTERKSPTPARRTSRATRIAIAHSLGGLLVALKSAQARETGTVGAAAAAIDAFSEELGEP